MQHYDEITPITQKEINKLKEELLNKYYLDNFGKFREFYGYWNNQNQIILISVLFQEKIVPFHLSNKKWAMGIPKNIRKINPFNITKKPKGCKNIFIVNTEREALTEIPGWHGLSWSGNNSKTINRTDWRGLANVENVLIWTDGRSAKKIKTRIPHSKIISSGKFKDCPAPLKVFEEKLKLNNLPIPEPDPFDFYKLFIHEFYGDDSLEQRNGIFWKYLKDKHHWEQEEFKDIKANFQIWFSEIREEAGASLLDFAKSEGAAVNKFMNNTIEFISRHTSTTIFNNPFKDSAISPYIHLENGMIHLSRKGKMAEWIERTEKNEDFFRKKYPVHCCEYDFNKKHLKAVTIDDAPVFKYVIDSFIPRDLKLSNLEIRRTRDFFAQVIAYSISPIKPTEYFFGLYGDEGTGKSFFIDVLKDIIGDRFFLERPIDEMTQNNRFASSDFWGSKVYVEPDMKTNSMLPEAFIKTFAGQKQITLEKKHTTPERGVNISIAMFFISNFDFITKGMEGLARRVIYIPFKNKIPNPDRTLRDKIRGEEVKGKEAGAAKGKQFDERPIVLALAMQGWKAFLKNDCFFTMPRWIVDAKNTWIQKSDTVKNFVTENYLDKGIWYEITRKELYNQYAEWCKEERDKKPYGKSRFYEEMGRQILVKGKIVGGVRMYEFFPDKRPVTEEIDPEKPF